MLSIKNLNAYYGKFQALWDVGFEVPEGEIVALVGANGAGKTTLLNTLSGLVDRTSGQVEFLGRRLEGRPPQTIVAQGLCQVPQEGRLFPDMTVRENLEMGAYLTAAWHRKQETLQEVYALFPLLKERSRQLARTLSGGEKQMVAIGRGLMSRPRLCMFDEPSYGLAPILVAEIFRIIKSLPAQGITVLLVEQNVKQALELADRACVVENGRLTLEGRAGDLLSDDHVRQAYLGL
ncbi:MAG: ABC transporter ATP-binding protein [Deltaproteobacteria bacterium]|nr:ABC transporter ATP-binding protein [Deltaproteobacteria bacterium]